MFAFSATSLALALAIMTMLPSSTTALKKAHADSSKGHVHKKSAKVEKVTREIIKSANVPPAIGPYSRAVRVGSTIYLSGTLGVDPKTEKLNGGIVEQTHQSLKNIGEVLKAAGSDYSRVVKTTVLLRNISDFATVNKIYGHYFKAPYPARAAYQVAALPKGGLVEIEAVAIAGEIEEISS